MGSARYGQVVGMQLDTGFRPSRHGFGFPNTWRDTIVGVVASRGRCGGMVFAALDAFRAGVPLPPEARARELPAHDSALARWIWGRQVASVAVRLGENLWRFARYTYAPSGSPVGIGARTRAELLTVFDALRAGRPVPLGLVSGVGPLRAGLGHLVRNHQVLAYAGEFAEQRVVLRVYDPNHPRRDDVTMEIPLDPRCVVVERVGTRSKPWRGLFVERYAPAPPLRS